MNVTRGPGGQIQTMGETYPDRNREVRWWVINGGMSYSEAANRVGQGLTRNAVAGIIGRTTTVQRANLGPKPL